MASDAIYVGQGSRFSDPFSGHSYPADAFYEWVLQQGDLFRLIRRELQGKRLYVTGAQSSAHIDTLSLIASGELDADMPPTPRFVYGSNLSGRNGKGAARFAQRYHGAEYGVGRGVTGSAYALPTKDEALRVLPLKTILLELDVLFQHALERPSDLYELTRVGCGLASKGAEHNNAIASHAIQHAPDNILLPGVWEVQRAGKMARVIVAGSRTFDHLDIAFEYLDKLLQRLVLNGRVEIVSGGARGADSLAESYAAARGLRIHRFPAEWELFGKSAGFVRNNKMAWYGTHLVSFWNGKSKGTYQMIQLAEQNGMPCRVVKI